MRKKVITVGISYMLITVLGAIIEYLQHHYLPSCILYVFVLSCLLYVALVEKELLKNEKLKPLFRHITYYDKLFIFMGLQVIAIIYGIVKLCNN